jgi:uncharacterized Fe-S cluster-containing radical SAM superfamily protein
LTHAAPAGILLTMAAPTFRDPPSADVRAAELELAIARGLVRAPSLPVDIALFKTTLLAVRVLPEAIELTFGRGGARIVSLRLAWSDAQGAVEASPRWEGPSRPLEDQKMLPALQQRLRAGISKERWDEAWKLRQEFLDLPRNVPIEAFRMLVPGSLVSEGLVRTGFNCNQDCGLCWQGRDWGKLPPAQILAWIEDLREAGAQTLIISGGEPTLDPELPRYIRRARELAYTLVTLETNAIQAAKAGYAAKLKDAGLQRAFVSLHSGDAATSDEITRAPGTHKRTIVGIRALLEAGITVALNAVITSESIGTLGDLPDYLREAFGQHPLLETLVVSDLGATYEEQLVPKLIPDPASTRAALPRLIERAAATKLLLNGLGGPCGPHLCMFGADPRAVSLAPIPGPVPFRRHLPACDGCAVRFACFGVRDGQADLFGDETVRPLREIPRLTV